MTTEVTVLVLAGGRSRRMGRDKAAIVLENESLLERTVRVAAAAMAGPVAVVTPWPDRYRALVPASACAWIEENTENTGGDGPLRGILQGLADKRPQLGESVWVLVLACDLPYLSSEELMRWKAQLDTVPATAIALLPRGLKGWEPLCGFYRRDCLASLTAYWSVGGRSLQDWLQQQAAGSVAILNVSDRCVLFNCNTPEDWARVAGGV